MNRFTAEAQRGKASFLLLSGPRLRFTPIIRGNWCNSCQKLFPYPVHPVNIGPASGPCPCGFCFFVSFVPSCE